MASPLARELLEKAVVGKDVFDAQGASTRMRQLQGIAATALPAIDVALWDEYGLGRAILPGHAGGAAAPSSPAVRTSLSPSATFVHGVPHLR